MKGSTLNSSSRPLSLALLALLAGCGTDVAGESAAGGNLVADASGSGAGDASLTDSGTSADTVEDTLADTAEDTLADTAVEDVAPDAESDTVADTVTDATDDTTTTLGELPCEVATILEANCQGCHGAARDIVSG